MDRSAVTIFSDQYSVALPTDWNIFGNRQRIENPAEVNSPACQQVIENEALGIEAVSNVQAHAAAPHQHRHRTTSQLLELVPRQILGPVAMTAVTEK